MKLLLVSVILLLSVMSVAAQGSDDFEANLKDENCWTRINSCNLEGNDTLMASVNGESQAILTVLKAANYQLQDDLNECENNKSTASFNRNITYISLSVAILAALWATYTIYLNRRDKDDLKKNG